RNFSDPDFQKEIRHLSFKVTQYCGSDSPIIEVEIEDRSVVSEEHDRNTTAKRVLRYTPEQITAMIFRELKGIAEREIGEELRPIAASPKPSSPSPSPPASIPTAPIHTPLFPPTTKQPNDSKKPTEPPSGTPPPLPV
ncbi:hypothetical protein N0V85_004372, partial [Neurospora sp. IMI 360204]